MGHTGRWPGEALLFNCAFSWDPGRNEAHNLLLSILWCVSVLACVCVLLLSPCLGRMSWTPFRYFCGLPRWPLWLSLMYTHFIICQWCNNHC